MHLYPSFLFFKVTFIYFVLCIWVYMHSCAWTMHDFQRGSQFSPSTISIQGLNSDRWHLYLLNHLTGSINLIEELWDYVISTSIFPHSNSKVRAWTLGVLRRVSKPVWLYYTTERGLELLSSCLCFPHVGITDVHHYSWLSIWIFRPHLGKLNSNIPLCVMRHIVLFDELF